MWIVSTSEAPRSLAGISDKKQPFAHNNPKDNTMNTNSNKSASDATVLHLNSGTCGMNGPSKKQC